VTLRAIAGLRTGTCVIGDGPPVLALHGWGGSVKSFWPVAERLSPHGYQVHLLDLPGFGQSDLPPDVWGVADYMRFVVAYLDDAGLDRVALLGHCSAGGSGWCWPPTIPARQQNGIDRLRPIARLTKQQTRRFSARRPLHARHPGPGTVA
jgi:pimeloyl-ACP methyl ester carboxylesterase